MANGCEDRIINEEYADFLFRYGESLQNIIERLDVCVERVNYNTAAVFTPIANLPPNFIHIYGYSVFPACFGLMDISAVEASGVERVRNIPNLNLRGQGVLIGVVDTGIEYTHSVFQREDGTSKIVSIWDQNIQTENGAPEGFFYGTEYTQIQINEALASNDPLSIVPSTDTNGHGTYLAGIAAGNVSAANNFSGVVPDAELVVVKLKPPKEFLRNWWRIPQNVECYQSLDIMMGVRYLLEVAARLRRPISILIGVGTSQGSHDESGFLGSYLSTIAVESGDAVSIAAGNEGNRGHHYFGTVAVNMEYDTVELRVGPNETGFSLEFWGETPFTFSFDILSPSGEYIPRIPARLNESREIRFIFEQTIIDVDYQIIEAESGAQLILVRFTSPAEGIWRFRVYSSGNLLLNYHIWLPIHTFISDQTYFIRPANETTLTNPGNTTVPLVVTAYDHATSALYLNASRGFNRLNNITPTLAAPGVNVIAPALNNGFHSVTGTSVAAAHTAGAAAIILEWGIVRGNYVQMSTVEIRNLLIRGARRDPALTYPNRDWGYGILDLYSAYNSLRAD